MVALERTGEYISDSAEQKSKLTLAPMVDVVHEEDVRLEVDPGEGW